MLTAIIPLVLVGVLVGLIVLSLVTRQGEPLIRLFGDAVIAGAGSILGIWLGLVLVGLIFGLIAGAFVAGCVSIGISLMEHASGTAFPLKWLVALR